MSNAILKKIILTRIDQARKDFDNQVSVAAEQYREEVLVPLCEKLGFGFLSGNGMFFFTKDGAGFNRASDAPTQKLRTKFKSIFEILDLEVGYNQSFGDYINDIRQSKK